MSDSAESLADCLSGLRAGRSDAVEQLWRRYFSSLAAFADAKLAGLTHRVSGEDVALSALKSVAIRLREGRLPSLVDSNGLWPLLIVITKRKAINARKQHHGGKQDVAREAPVDFGSLISDEPSPEFVVQLSDELDHLMSELGDPSLKRIAALKLEGRSHAEIAEQLGVATKTVSRKLARIRSEWSYTAQRD